MLLSYSQCMAQAWNVGSREALLGLCAVGLLLANLCSKTVEVGPATKLCW